MDIRRTIAAVALALLPALPAFTGGAQERQSAPRRAEGPRAGNRRGNPLAGDPVAVARGAESYRKLCAACHGANARGAEGPDLYRSRVALLASPRALFELLRDGMPGSEMPPFRIPEEHLWQIVAYVHSLTRPGMGPPVAGDPEAGRRVFEESGCFQCHQVGGKGGVVGPELSSIALRSSSEKIRESVLAPEAEIAEGYPAVSVTTAAGDTITGTLKNEDNFSLQIMKLDGRFALLARSEVKHSKAEHRSLMPRDFGRKLSPGDLQNLLAFLDRQRAPFVRLVSTFQNY